jgi:hypothetical protein
MDQMTRAGDEAAQAVGGRRAPPGMDLFDRVDIQVIRERMIRVLV